MLFLKPSLELKNISFTIATKSGKVNKNQQKNISEVKSLSI